MSEDLVWIYPGCAFYVVRYYPLVACGDLWSRWFTDSLQQVERTRDLIRGCPRVTGGSKRAGTPLLHLRWRGGVGGEVFRPLLLCVAQTYYPRESRCGPLFTVHLLPPVFFR